MRFLRGVKKNNAMLQKNIALFKFTYRNVWFKASQYFS